MKKLFYQQQRNLCSNRSFYVILLLTFLFQSSSSLAQRIEVNTGVSYNKFFDAYDYQYKKSFSSQFGHYIGIGYDFGQLRYPIFQLAYSTYSGRIDVADGGLGGRTAMTGSINKTVLSLDVYVLRFKRMFDFDFGISTSLYLFNKNSLNLSGFIMGNPPIEWEDMVDTKNPEFNRTFNFGLSGRIRYPFKIYDKIKLIPHYQVFLGITEEFKNIQGHIKSFRHYLGLGISYQLIK